MQEIVIQPSTRYMDEVERNLKRNREIKWRVSSDRFATGSGYRQMNLQHLLGVKRMWRQSNAGHRHWKGASFERAVKRTWCQLNAMRQHAFTILSTYHSSLFFIYICILVYLLYSNITL